jgi:hypothetical protein
VECHFYACPWARHQPYEKTMRCLSWMLRTFTVVFLTESEVRHREEQSTSVRLLLSRLSLATSPVRPPSDTGRNSDMRLPGESPPRCFTTLLSPAPHLSRSLSLPHTLALSKKTQRCLRGRRRAERERDRERERKRKRKRERERERIDRPAKSPSCFDLGTPSE